MDIQCPNCKRNNSSNAVICAHCGKIIDTVKLLLETETHNLKEDFEQRRMRDRTTHFDHRKRLLLHVLESNKIIEVDVFKSSGLLVGRMNPLAGEAPDVDLTKHDGAAQGVSRKHARLDTYRNRLFITDLGSTNGTYLNGVRLPELRPHLLGNGDEVRIGNLKLVIDFVDATDLSMLAFFNQVDENIDQTL